MVIVYSEPSHVAPTLLKVRDHFDFDIRALGQRSDLNCGARREIVREVF
jgi:hypothetical protein